MVAVVAIVEMAWVALAVVLVLMSHHQVGQDLEEVLEGQGLASEGKVVVEGWVMVEVFPLVERSVGQM
ncbi:MAG: hypothetical protein HZC10_06025 [Nitrospirae bacterium]|nr:hypothetical protein [Nitrospirota bacterium]